MNQLKDGKWWLDKWRDPTLQETHFKYYDVDGFNGKRQKNICHADINQEKKEMAIFISSNVDFIEVNIPAHCVTVKGSFN